MPAKIRKIFDKAVLLLGQKIRAVGKNNREIFDDIYANRRWKGDGEISSGLGSATGVFGQYEDFIVKYIEDNGISSMLDIGCGDFQVAGRILSRLSGKVDYIGADVSTVVIEHNTRCHAAENVKFIQLDAVNDPLPTTQLVVVREVLQHLSNSDIGKILSKLQHFEHVLISNHTTVKATRVNMDIPSGAATRSSFGSRLELSESPFNLEVETVLKADDVDTGQRFVTSRLLR